MSDGPFGNPDERADFRARGYYPDLGVWVKYVKTSCRECGEVCSEFSIIKRVASDPAADAEKKMNDESFVTKEEM